MTGPDRARVEVSSRAELRAWLLTHHGQTESVWLVTWKKAVAHRYVSREEVLDELVAFGWIDGVRQRLDDERTMQLVSPRRTQPWARSCRDRAERLLADGLMHNSGRASVEAAWASGPWTAMEDVDALLVPDDLRAELDARPPAGEVFDGLAPSVRRNVLRWIASAERPPTRERRIALTVAEAEQGRAVRSHG